jgi:hypothetical protein
MGLRNTFSTIQTDVNRNRTVNVESLNVFDDIRVGNKVTFVGDITYNITKSFSWEDLEFIITPDSRISFTTSNAIANGINTEISGSQVLFSGDVQRFDIMDVDITSANGGTCFDMVGTIVPGAGLPAVFLEGMSITGFDTIGTFDSLSMFSVFMEYVSNNGPMTLMDSFAVRFTEQAWVEHTGIHLAVDGLIGFGFFDVFIGSPKAGDYMFHISNGMAARAGFTGLIHIQGGAHDLTNPGGWFDPAGLDQTHPQVKLTDVENEIDSYWVGSTGFTGNSTETILSDTTTFVKIAGTYVDGYAERFTFSNGVATFTGVGPVYVDASASVKLLLEPGIETDVVEISIFKNSSEVTITREQQSLTDVFQTPTSPEFQPRDNIMLENGDTLEIRMRNTSNATNITATDAKIMVRR